MKLGNLANLIGFTGDTALLQQALTHRSAGSPSYERLEFVGDRVLNLAVAAWLYRLNPGTTEGQLSLQHTALVREGSCTSVAEQWGLWPLIEMTNKTKQSVPTQRRVLADTTEAVLGALFLIHGMEAVQRLVERDWAALLNLPEGGKDAKTWLQEHLQAAGHALPVYTTLAQAGPDHAAAFTVEVACTLGRIEATGPSKQAASLAAAAALIRKLNL